MLMKVLITGGTGTISSGLVQESVNRNYETYAITRGTNNKRNIQGAKYLHADVWNTEHVREAINNLEFDVVVECLALNVEQMKISLENFADKCDQYIFISSVAVYNRVGNNRIKESDKKEFYEWAYAKNKMECEKFLIAYARKTGLKYTIIRPTVTYGDYRIPFPIATRTPGWTFFDRIQKGKLILASNNVLFSVIHIYDFSRMVVSLFENDHAVNEDFHISANGNEIYWDDVINKSAELLHIIPKVVHVHPDVIRKVWPAIYDEITLNKGTTLILDDQKIKNATSIVAHVDIEKGLKKTIAAMEKEYKDGPHILDNKWNDYCNATIYYAYRKNKLSKEDKEIVSNYINQNGEYEFKESLKKVLFYNFISQKYLSKIHRMVKRILLKH